MTAPATALELSDVGVVLNRSPILRGVDLQVEAGEVLGIVGANGSGKTTLLRVLATLIAPSRGSVRILGLPPEAARPQIELIGHTPALYPELTLGENLRFVARLTGRPTDEVDTYLVRVGLTGAGDRRADRSSHGMQRRVEFARALLRRPQVLLLDEAHAGLDAEARALVDHVVEHVTGRHGVVVMVSHEPDRISGLAGRVLRLVNGALSPDPSS